MSFDPLPLFTATARWRDAEIYRLPQHPAEPVIWIGDDDCLQMYHPAIPLNIRSIPRDWTRQSFDAIVKELMPEAAEVIVNHIRASQAPEGYYADYPEAARRALSDNPTIGPVVV